MDTAHHGMDSDHHGTVTRLPLVETTPSVTVRSLGYPRTVVVPVLVMVWPPLPVNLLMIVTGPQLVVLTMTLLREQAIQIIQCQIALYSLATLSHTHFKHFSNQYTS